jgi:outer membrane protein
MKRNGMIWTALASAMVLTAASRASAQGVTEERIQALIRDAAARAGVNSGSAATGLAAGGAGQTTAQPTPATRPGTPTGPSVQMTLDDAIKLALDRNLDIAVQRLNPQTFDYSIANLRATYRPTLTSSINRVSQTDPSRSTTQGGGAGFGIAQATDTYNGGIAQNIPWGGGTLAVNLNNNRQTTNSLTTRFNPAFNTNWAAQYTQPLLRGFRIDSTRQSLAVTRLNQDVSEIQLQASIINTVSNVKNAYWDYVFATESVEVARRSVELADRLVSDNRVRVEIGTMAPIDIVQAQSQAATQRQNLATAEGTRRTTELALKRLIVNGTQDPNWTVSINPTDRPDFVSAPIDIPAAVRHAIESRTDLQQARKNLQVNDVTLKFLRNQTLPQIDAVVRYGLVGQGGTRYIRAGGIAGEILETIPGGYSDALNTLVDRNYPSWTVGLNISYGIGTTGAEATVARSRVQLNQVEAQVRQIELQIATDITNAATQVESNVERVEAAQAARDFAQQQLEAEQSKFEVGMSTNYFVVQSQRDLATAQNNELQAILAYRRSLVELERLQQTSLTTSNITILGSTAR